MIYQECIRDALLRIEGASKSVSLASGMQDASDAGCRMQDAGCIRCRMQDAGCIRDGVARWLRDHNELGLWEVCDGNSREDVKKLGCSWVCSWGSGEDCWTDFNMGSTWIASRTAPSVAWDHQHRV